MADSTYSRARPKNTDTQPCFWKLNLPPLILVNTPRVACVWCETGSHLALRGSYLVSAQLVVSCDIIAKFATESEKLLRNYYPHNNKHFVTDLVSELFVLSMRLFGRAAESRAC